MSDESYKPEPSGKPARIRAAARPSTSYMAYRGGEVPDENDPLLGFAPVPHKQLKKNSLGPERQRQFIAALAASGVVTDAAKTVGASLEAFYALRNRPGAEEFRAAWDEAVDRALVRVEAGAVGRAIEGVEKPIVSGGKLLGWHKVHNEALVMFLLRQRRAARYGAELTLSLKPGHPLYEKIKREVIAEDMEDEEETRASLDSFLEGMRERRLANEKVLAEFEAESGRGGDGDEGELPALPGPEAETSPEPPVVEPGDKR